MIIVVLEIIVCLILAGIIGVITGWFLHRFKVEPTYRAMERLVMNLQDTESTLLDVKAESRIHAARAEVLETELRSKAIAAQTLENEISSLGARLSTAEESLEASKKERNDVGRELARAQDHLLDARTQIEELQQTREVSVTALAEKSQEIDRLLARITEAESNYQTDLMDKDAELATTQERTGDIEAQLSELGDAKSRLLEENESCKSTLRERELELEQLRDTIRTLEHQLQGETLDAVPTDVSPPDAEEGSNGTEAVASEAASTEDGSDDLKKISGVGPKLELLLHDLGVHSFRQVALWSEEEIDRVDAQLERFRGRIRREGWVESAREEFLRKYGKQPEAD